MVIKRQARQGIQTSLNIQTISGDELHKLEAKSNAEYLVIELGDLEGRIPHFTDAIKAAMKAAIISLTTAFSGYADETPSSLTPRKEENNTNKTAKLTTAAKDKTPAVEAEPYYSEKTERQRRHAERLAKHNAAIIEDSVWLTANDLSQKTGFKSTNPSAGPNRWKSSGKIFAIQLQGKDLYPEYALDEGFRPLPIIKKIILMFGERKTPWGLATWFGAENSWLGGRKPKDMLISAPEQVLLAAREETLRGTHG
jgi:hypothetical protein